MKKFKFSDEYIFNFTQLLIIIIGLNSVILYKLDDDEHGQTCVLIIM